MHDQVPRAHAQMTPSSRSLKVDTLLERKTDFCWRSQVPWGSLG